MESVEAMEKLNELLPGIEEFLVQILPQEKLSPVAEERRQYFVERLDILRLPPSLPPRAGKRLSVELLEESEEQCGIPADQVPELGSILVPEGALEGAQGTLSEAEKDFAAEQRKISRNMVASVSSEKEAEDTEESDSAKGVKVYDDIDPTESIKSTDRDDEDDDDINALYEIPVARQPQPPASEENSLSQPADISSMATAGSIDDISDDVLDATAPAWQPPPLPPRTKKKESESTESRVSSNSLDGSSKPPELPFRPPLPRRNEVHYARSEKSDKSEKSEKSDVSDGDSTSYESFDENEHDTELMSKLNIKLPKRPKKKSKTSAKLLSSKARSSSTWEINVPFKKLDNIVLSGEMLHKGKLSWNRRLVAISNGCMALYKPDKETRPVFVIPLAGFSAYLGEPLGRKGFEMKMTHENGEAYTFAVDFKEWVSLWCEHINGLSQGLSVPSYHQHLVRTFSGGSDQATFGSKGNLSNSNLSLSSDGVESDDSSKPRLRANKVMRMGSFAYRATQFFENLGKKTTSKRKVSSLSSPADVTEYNMRDGIQEESSLSSASIGGPAVSPSSEATSPVFEDSFRNSSAFSSPSSMEFPPLPPTPPPSIPTNIKHQGYLNIFSSFNKRRWGQRWCLVRENMFECYRNQTSQPCELNFLLKNCVLRQALAETNSPLSLMLLENNREKITVEPPSKEELSQWLRVLMMETATESVPPGLEEFFVEVDDNQVEDLTAALEAEYSDIVGASVLKSWEVGSVPILPSKDKAADDIADNASNPAADQGSKEDSPDHDDASTDQADSSPPDKYLYSTVIKRPSFAALEQLDDKGDSQQEEAVTQQQPEDSKVPCFKDNLAVYNANKNTTDSGFYSVKETNSDSESGSDVKTDSVSPTQESPLSASAEDRGSSVCETPDPKVTDSGGASGKEPAVEEEDEEESALEKTMTSEDFKENLDSEKTMTSEYVQDSVDGGQDAVCSASSALNVEPAEEENNGCENHRQDSKAEGDVSVPSGKDKDSASGGVTKENHEHSEKVDSQLANSEEVQQQDKPKKKKKKGKGKKNKQKQQETSEKSSVDKVASSAKSQSKPTSDNPEASGIPGCGPSTVDEGAEGSQSSVHRQLHSGACQSSSVSAPSPEGGEGDRGRGPDEDEMIVDLKERIGKLREKLVQIKRKRIAVRDKRVRAFSAEERNACDKEYLVLESECKETAAIIQTLEEELRAASASAANKS